MNHEIKTLMNNTLYYTIKPPGTYGRYNVYSKWFNDSVDCAKTI